MNSIDKEKIKDTVRNRYGEIARARGVSNEMQIESCGGASTGAEHGKKTMLPLIDQRSSCCGEPDYTAEQMAAYMNKLGYSKDDLANAPDGANMMLGCGNPVALASLKKGETVVDLGSGGGFDCFLAAKEVGKTGTVIGVDMTSDMIGKARLNAEKIKTKNVEFRLGEIEHLPIADNTADIIMSNCVINLSPDKLQVYRDAYRVLKPGGRLAISDVVARAQLPDEIRSDLSLLSSCIGGAATIEDTKRMLKKAGFKKIKISYNNKSQEIIKDWTPDKRSKALDYVVSAYIEAVKP